MSKTKHNHDYSIEKPYSKEIDLQTKVSKSKKEYKRKDKHKARY